MAMPVVATSVACAGLRFENGRNLEVADNPAAFADAVVSLMRDPERRRRLGSEARRTAEQFYGWDAAAARLLDLYDRYARRGPVFPGAPPK